MASGSPFNLTSASWEIISKLDNNIFELPLLYKFSLENNEGVVVVIVYLLLLFI